MKSLRLLFLMCLILNLVRTYDTWKEAKEALVSKKALLKTKEKEMYAIDKALPGLELQEKKLNKLNLYFNEQTAELIKEENELKQNFKLAKDGLPILDSNIKVYENLCRRKIKNEVFNQSEFMTNGNVIKLIRKRQSTFGKETELKILKQFYEEWRALKFKIYDLSSDLTELPDKLENYKNSLEDREKRLAQEEEDYKNKDDEYIKEIIQNRIEYLKSEISMLTKDIKEIEKTISIKQQELSEVNRKEHEKYDAFNSKDLFNEMLSIVAPGKQQAFSELNEKLNSLVDQKLKPELEKIKAEFEKNNMDSELKFYELLFDLNNNDETAKSELERLNEKNDEIEENWRTKSQAFNEILGKEENTVKIIDAQYTELKNYEVKEEGFNKIELDTIKSSIEEIFFHSYFKYLYCRNITKEKNKKTRFEVLIELLPHRIELLGALSPRLVDPLHQIVSDLKQIEQEKKTGNENITRLLKELKDLENEIPALETEVWNLYSKERDERESSKLAIISVIFIVFVIVSLILGMCLKRRQDRRAGGSNVINSDDLLN